MELGRVDGVQQDHQDPTLLEFLPDTLVEHSMETEQPQQSHFSDSSDDEKEDAGPLSPRSVARRDNDHCARVAKEKGYHQPSSAITIFDGEIVPWARDEYTLRKLALKSLKTPCRIESGVTARPSPLNPGRARAITSSALSKPPLPAADPRANELPEELLDMSRSFLACQIEDPPGQSAEPKSDSASLDRVTYGGNWADLDEEDEQRFEANLSAASTTDKVAGANVVEPLKPDRGHRCVSASTLDLNLEKSSVPKQSPAIMEGILQKSPPEKFGLDLGINQEQSLAAAREAPDTSCSPQTVLEKHRILLHFDIEEQHVRRHREGQPRLPVPETETQQRRDERSRAMLREYVDKYEVSEARCQQLHAKVEAAAKQVDDLQILLQEAFEMVETDNDQELRERVEQQEEELARMKQKLADTKQLCKEKLRAEQDRCEKLQEHISELEDREDLAHAPVAHVEKLCARPEQLAQAEELKKHLEELQARYSDLLEKVDRISTQNQQLEKELEVSRREHYSLLAQPPSASTEHSIEWPKTRPFSLMKANRPYAASSSAKLGAAPSIASETVNIDKVPRQHAASLTAQSTSASTLVKQIKKSRRSSDKAMKGGSCSPGDSYNAVPPPLPSTATGVRLGFAQQTSRHRDWEPPQPLEWQKRVKKWRHSTVWREHHEILSRYRQQQDQEQSEYELLKNRAFETRFGYSLSSDVPYSKQDHIRLFHDALHGPARQALTMVSLIA